MNPELDQPQTTPPAEPSTDLSDYPEAVYQPAAPALDEAASAEGQPSGEPTATSDGADEMIRWQATGRSQKSRGSWWHLAAIMVAVIFILADLFLFKSYSFSVLVVVMLAALFVYLKVPPQEVEYTLSGRQGLYIGGKLFHLSEFKAFGITQNDDFNAVTLIPVKRFAPGVVVPFPDEVGEPLVDILGQRLPMEDIKPDLVDALIRRLNL